MLKIENFNGDWCEEVMCYFVLIMNVLAKWESLPTVGKFEMYYLLIVLFIDLIFCSFQKLVKNFEQQA